MKKFQSLQWNPKQNEFTFWCSKEKRQRKIEPSTKKIDKVKLKKKYPVTFYPQS